MTILGVLFLGVAVGFMNYSNFGMDPFQTFAHGVALHVLLLSVLFHCRYGCVNA